MHRPRRARADSDQNVLLRPCQQANADRSFGLSCGTVTLSTSIGDRRALVLTPTRSISLVEPPEVSGQLSDADRWILDTARYAVEEELASFCIFRGRDETTGGAYGFAEALSEDDAAEVATAMLQGQILVYREMVRLGLCLIVHTDFGYAEAAAFRTAIDRLLTQLEPKASGDDLEARRARLDQWILQNLVFFFTGSFETLASTILPDKLPMMEKRMERIRRMAAMVE